MSRKRIGVAALVTALGVAVLVGTPGASGASPYSETTGITFKKKATFKKRSARIGTETCGVGTCKVGQRSASVSVSGQSFTATLKAPASLRARSRAAIKLKLSAGAQSALVAAGTGEARVSLTVNGQGGVSTSRSAKIRIRG
ncbi:MAG: hypothetical protein ACXWEL_06655 [Solirubrobacterales bacterium]